MSQDNDSRTRSRGPYDGCSALPLSTIGTATGAAGVGERLRFHGLLADAGELDAAFIRRDSDVLVVTFHGSLDRDKFTIPRFERARTTEEFDVSCLYWADPSLWLDETLPLAWYTGAGDLNLAELLALRSQEVAAAIGAKRIIFTGSSGGGFAALQISALVPGSTALVFNPQTAISAYWKQSQRHYVSVCAPNVLPVPADEFDFSTDWSADLDDRYSAVRRYSTPTQNHVIYWTNTNDWHHAKHFQPFRSVIDSWPGDTAASLTVHAYDGPNGHNVPTPELFREALAGALGTSAE